MITIRIIGIILCLVYFLLFLYFAIKSRRPIRFMVYNAGLGVLFLIISTVIGDYFEISVNFNIYTLLMSGLWGIPGDILMILIDLLFM